MTTLKDALADLLQNAERPVEDAAQRHLTDTFRQSTNGQWEDRAEFLSRITHLREYARDLTVTVLSEFTRDNRYAERHIVQLVGNDGARLTQEVFMFASMAADGRFERIEELTRVVDEDQTPSN